MTETSPDNWFVLQLKPNGLKRATEHLTRQGFSLFSPKIAATGTARGRIVVKQAPMFPGYAFVQIDRSRPDWRAVQYSRGVSRLILSDPRNPRPMPAAFMADLFARIGEGDMFVSADELVAGDTVEVTAGPFARLLARVQDLDDTGRIALLLEIMGRETTVTIDRAHLRRT